jgi:hypothetical protein
MAERDDCYTVRDAYYACVDAKLDEAGGSPADAAKACEHLRGGYEAGCRKAWVKYWDDRRRKGLPLRRATGDELRS